MFAISGGGGGYLTVLYIVKSYIILNRLTLCKLLATDYRTFRDLSHNDSVLN